MALGRADGRAGGRSGGEPAAVSTGTPGSPSGACSLRPFLAAAAASGGVLIILVTGYSLAGGVAGLASAAGGDPDGAILPTAEPPDAMGGSRATA